MHPIHTTGYIEVITGSMFSGKSEELIRRLKRAQFAKQIIQVFKPVIDNRYDSNAVVSHGGFRFEGIAVDQPRHVLYLVKEETHVVGIDEVQFFNEDIVRVAEALADSGKRVIIAGLDQDFRGEPFGPMPFLLARAEYVTKTQAICVVCGGPGTRSQRLTLNEGQVVVGETEVYEARCRKCHRRTTG